MQTQPVFSHYDGSCAGEEPLYQDPYYFKQVPTIFGPCEQTPYPHPYQSHGVRIAQQEESLCGYGGLEGGYGGMWGVEGPSMEGIIPKQFGSQDYYPPASAPQHPRPLLSLSTSFEHVYNENFIPDTAMSTISSANPDMGTYSNESSPFLDQYTLPMAPRTPITPATTPIMNGQFYTAPGVPGAFMLVPMIARDPAGNMTTVFVPKQTAADAYFPEQSSLELLGCRPSYQEHGYSMGLSYNSPEHPSFQLVVDKEEHAEVDDDEGPELVGMGLYDDPPELLYSASTTPELARLCPPEMNGTGRGLVLEQSFGLPEEDDDEEEDEGEECRDDEVNSE
ncbi:hypothetical protein BDZ91DRAFT_723947 [Kalaharituber pfeilii]|nr:hypothetical protein BDZ91DRAFT_723947 [Kalaharituber pfeilii]